MRRLRENRGAQSARNLDGSARKSCNRNPAFDVTRRDYIHAFICEEGIISPHSILRLCIEDTSGFFTSLLASRASKRLSIPCAISSNPPRSRCSRWRRQLANCPCSGDCSVFVTVNSSTGLNVKSLPKVASELGQAGDVNQPDATGITSFMPLILGF